MSSAKRNWMEGGRGGLCHKREICAGWVGIHPWIGGLVVPRLAHHIAISARQEIGAKDNESLVIETHKAGI